MKKVFNGFMWLLLWGVIIVVGLAWLSDTLSYCTKEELGLMISIALIPLNIFIWLGLGCK